jgi:hypothetical protein
MERAIQPPPGKPVGIVLLSDAERKITGYVFFDGQRQSLRLSLAAGN